MDVKHIAKLANLILKSDEEAKFKKQFEETLQTVNLINELDTSGIESTSQVTGLINVTREDVIDKSRILPPPKSNNGYFIVSSIFNAE